ncbi:unnamed protein product [Rotaria sp. Silwood2]|nr:unnamed protein product [Rotaria sp. Silwood2]CAF3323473.1 unnamed protein product [Rotaria sp. Silwood2]CAF4412236.1 unnamed protein product [Rotaria sp. Silwood2]
MNGFIYNNSFNAVLTSENLIPANIERLFFDAPILRCFIDTLSTYILVVTTDAPNIFGSFTVTAAGPGSLTYIELEEQ